MRMVKKGEDEDEPARLFWSVSSSTEPSEYSCDIFLTPNTATPANESSATLLLIRGEKEAY